MKRPFLIALLGLFVVTAPLIGPSQAATPQQRRAQTAKREAMRRKMATHQAKEIKLQRLHVAGHQVEVRARTAEKIERALRRDSQLHRFYIDVNSKGGTNGYIELDGRVKTQAQRSRAEGIARPIAASFRLVDSLHIGA